MDYDTVIVRYGEIFLKSDPVMREFENRLVENLHSAAGEGRISRRRHRLYIHPGDPEETAVRVSLVFGVVSASPAKRCKISDISDIAVRLAKERITPNNKFAVRCERTGKHDFSSKDIEVRLGSDIVKATGAGVNLTRPDVTVSIEIRDNEAFVFHEKVQGVGGLPYGTQGKVLALIDCPNSYLAAWMMARRGCEVIAVGKICGEKLGILEKYTAKKIRAIEKEISPDHIEEIAKGEGAHGVVSADTLETIKTRRFAVPLYTPLIGLSDEEIEGLRTRIGI